jgi:hypothetical protein
VPQAGFHGAGRGPIALHVDPDVEDRTILRMVEQIRAVHRRMCFEPVPKCCAGGEDAGCESDAREAPSFRIFVVPEQRAGWWPMDEWPSDSFDRMNVRLSDTDSGDAGIAPSDGIRRVVHAAYRPMVDCYERELASNHDLSDTLSLTIEIDANGAVASASADKSSSPALSSCVLGIVRGLHFARSDTRRLRVT